MEFFYCKKLGVRWMKIAIMSDSHDSILNLKKAISLAKEKEAKVLFHCGDLISPFMVPVLAEFGKETHLILGNNRGDIYLMSQHLKKYPYIQFHGESAEVEIGGYKIAMVHYPRIAYALALTGEYDFVFCGHTHNYEVKEVGRCLVINPGELLGKDEDPGFVILDAEKKQVERIKI